MDCHQRRALTNNNLGFKENLRKVKISVDLEPIGSYQLIKLPLKPL